MEQINQQARVRLKIGYAITPVGAARRNTIDTASVVAAHQHADVAAHKGHAAKGDRSCLIPDAMCKLYQRGPGAAPLTGCRSS